jgi:hypothetical protein
MAIHYEKDGHVVTITIDRPEARNSLTGEISLADLEGLGEFVRSHSRFRPLVVRDDEACPVAERAGFEAMPWTEFLLHGLPPARTPRERARIARIGIHRA